MFHDKHEIPTYFGTGCRPQKAKEISVKFLTQYISGK
jgi:hypothetical protein